MAYMLSHGRLGLALAFGCAILLVAVSAEGAATLPGPGKCHPECTKYGNCGDDGKCRCPFGRLGEGCEVDFLAPCRQFPDALPYCGGAVAKSCTCLRRCREYMCRPDASNNTLCATLMVHYLHTRGCYMRDGVEPDKQYSLVPAENEAGVKYLEGYREDAPEVPRSQALLWEDVHSVPITECPDKCNKRGYCGKHKPEDPAGFCRCHRGFKGAMCESEQPTCYLKCSGRGKCLDQFCHCEPPYFSIGCSRSTVYPANHSRPSPVNFKIYMYELNTQIAYDNAYRVEWHGHDPNYIAYQKFMDQFLNSPVRTEDPSEANLFYIPAFLYSYSGNTGTGWEHVQLLLDHVRTQHPWWNRTGGRDHFFWVPADRGTCHWGDRFGEPIRIVHFGMHSTQANHHEHFGHQGNPAFGCYHPLKDVVAVPFDTRIQGFLNESRRMSAEDHIKEKKRLFFFAGGTRKDDHSYAGNTRYLLSELVAQWKDPDFSWTEGYVNDYMGQFRQTRFCLAPYGYGYGMRLHQSIIGGCVPVVIQEHVFQPWEAVLPYESFSLRLNNDDLPRLREILRGVTEEQYRGLMQNLVRYKDAFHWERELGGRAFDYAIAALRRRHLNMKALYY